MTVMNVPTRTIVEPLDSRSNAGDDTIMTKRKFAMATVAAKISHNREKSVDRDAVLKLMVKALGNLARNESYLILPSRAGSAISISAFICKKMSMRNTC
jgi:hypothetical protein